MAALSDQYTLAITPAFIQRIEVALVTAALAVVSEAPTTPNHSARLRYALRVTANPAIEAAVVAMGIVTNATIAATAPSGASATDGDIQSTVAAIFDAYAGW